ncbi:hypothetical protein DV738_g1522, partial [Chaetothyriales sp. CBS 135597]
MTSIIHPIHSISQKCRPKHQVLVLKCYPKYQKNVQEAKPSSSELSYLLYYASSRRTKLQKVGAFLEKKVGTDVWMGRLSNVQVSLQIVTALIERTPRDLTLYSASVLNILDSVLRSRDINMVEESLPTFEAFCRHVDAANLGADTQRAKRYLVILKLYTGFVDKNPQEKHRLGESVTVAVRWRTAGLRGIKAAVTSNALTVDADQQLNLAAEDEVRALALRCLKQIFSAGISSARGQTRLATAHVLKFIAAKRPSCTPVNEKPTDNWATALFEVITRWTPVHDRYVIMLTAVETLVRSPVIEPMLEKQLVLATLIDWLLSSDINLIGLSVMDVLIGFIYHTLLLLQLGGRESARQSDILGIYREAEEKYDPPASGTGEQDQVRSLAAKEKTASPIRQALLLRLQNCVAALSNHIYYTDQITDMITAILARLKPTSASDISTTAQAISNPAATTRAIAEAANLTDDSSTDSFFSFATARSTGLKAVKAILVRANSGRSTTGLSADARSRVGVHAWDGTQWLLKDSDSEVRLAYIDALLTWLRLETNQNDLVLLHLAVYDAALERAANGSDVLLLHLLLSMLVERLGVNAARSGLPMILKLQDDALVANMALTPAGRVNLASLVHGYLWTVAHKFGFETSNTGKEILGEISRRKQLSLWFEKIKVPASSVESIRSIAVSSEKSPIYAVDGVKTLRPFLSVELLVDEIAASYDKQIQAPASAAPSPPGRGFSVPTLDPAFGSDAAPGFKLHPHDPLADNVKDEMRSTWSREACIASAVKDSHNSVPRSASGSLSASGTGPGLKNHLSGNGWLKGDFDGELNHNENQPQVAGLQGELTQGQPNHAEVPSDIHRLKKTRSAASHLLDAAETTSTAGTPSRDTTVKVTELKRALSGFVSTDISGTVWRGRHFTPTSGRAPDGESTASWYIVDEQALSSKQAQVAAAAIKPATTPAAAPVAKEFLAPNFGAERPPVSPLRNEDVPESRTASSLYLPGKYPRDGVVESSAAASTLSVAENVGRSTSESSTAPRENGVLTDGEATKPTRQIQQ